MHLLYTSIEYSRGISLRVPWGYIRQSSIVGHRRAGVLGELNVYVFGPCFPYILYLWSETSCMTPKDLVNVLLHKNEKEGRSLLQTCVADFDETSLALLVDLIKREADRQWNKDAHISFTLAGYLMAIGDLTRHKAYHALGLMSRGDALRRMHRDQDALPFLDAAGEEFLSIDDEVGWARPRIGRFIACLKLNRTTEALRGASAARDVFMRLAKLLRSGQIDATP